MCSSGKTPSKAKRISSIVAPERLRTAVKEKEAKIEQLLKERDMERKEISKAASQTEEAENSLDVLRKNFMSYKAQSTQQVTTLVIYEDKIFRARAWRGDE